MTVKWDAGKLIYEDSEASTSRRKRVPDVLKYKYELLPDGAGVLFKSGAQMRVKMGEQCTCTCPDFSNRQLACKHIFAAAHIMGDQSVAIAPGSEQAELPLDDQQPAAKKSSTWGGAGSKQFGSGKWRPETRPQDVRVGEYFVLSDFLYNESAAVKGWSNKPPAFDGPRG